MEYDAGDIHDAVRNKTTSVVGVLDDSYGKLGEH